MVQLEHLTRKWALEDPLFPKHMSFIIGPRQSGKTTLAVSHLLNSGGNRESHYFNWDNFSVRSRFRESIDWLSALRNPRKCIPLVFDEIHKVRNWKRQLKAIYDQFRDDFQFIVTGSGRLDHFQRGGDSLAGRYDPYYLLPFTPGEIERRALNINQNLGIEELFSVEPVTESTLQLWEITGGFPEPFLTGSEAKAKAWFRSYLKRVTEEDLRDLTRLESVDLLREILILLPSRIGSPLSIQNIRESVETSFETVKRYVKTLSQLFITFEVPPFSKKIHRAIRKEKKIYFYHHPVVENEGARFENMVAIILQRWVFQKTEQGIGEFELCYLRDQDRREVDFLVVKNQKPYFLFEAKRSDTGLANSLRHYSEKLRIPGVQIIRQPGIYLKKGPQIGVLSIHKLCGLLG